MAVSACGYPNELGRRLEQRVERIEGESAVRRPEDERAATEALARRLDARIAAMQKELDALKAAPQAGGPDRGARVDALTEDVRRLRVTLEQQAERLDAMERKLGRPKPAPREPSPASTSAAVGVGALTPVPREETLVVAHEQELKGETAVARSLYEEFVKEFPTHPAAAEAHFRLGELAFAERRYRDAIRSYGKVAKDFSRSARAPDAALRTADSMVAEGLRDEAMTLLAEIPKRYPGTPAASRAGQRLAELKGAPGAGKRR